MNEANLFIISCAYSRHPWETVVHAAWRKYPNPINPAVKGIDVLERKISKDGVLRSERILKTEWDVPSWVTSVCIVVIN